MIGHRYTRLTVIAETGELSKDGRLLWLCKCLCGAEKKVSGYSLRRGKTRSCGCLHREITRANYRKRAGGNALDDVDEDIVR